MTSPQEGFKAVVQGSGSGDSRRANPPPSSRRASARSRLRQTAKGVLPEAIVPRAFLAPSGLLVPFWPAALRAGEVDRALAAVDGSELVPVAALPAATCLARLGPPAVGAGDRRVAREEKALIGVAASAAQARLRILPATARRAGTALERLVAGQLARVLGTVAAAGTPCRGGELDPTALWAAKDWV